MVTPTRLVLALVAITCVYGAFEPEDHWNESSEASACDGKLTSWGKQCAVGCLKACKKKPNKTCCNKKMDQAACATATGVFCGAADSAMIEELAAEEGPCAGKLTSWNKECPHGCLKACKKKPNKTCCSKKMQNQATCEAKEGIFCGAADIAMIVEAEDDEAEDDAAAAEEGPCAGKLTSWNKECTGCLKACKKNPNKTCCNKRMDQTTCEAKEGLFCAATDSAMIEELAAEEGPCAGKRTSWNKECPAGCLKACRKKPNKTCCNRKMDQAACATESGLFCGLADAQELLTEIYHEWQDSK